MGAAKSSGRFAGKLQRSITRSRSLAYGGKPVKLVIIGGSGLIGSSVIRGMIQVNVDALDGASVGPDRP